VAGADNPCVGTLVLTEKDRGRSCPASDPQEEHFTADKAEATRAEKFNPQDEHWYRKTGIVVPLLSMRRI